MTTHRPMTSAERAIRIELAQARASLERRRLLRGSQQLVHDAQPGALFRSLVPQLGAVRPTDLVWKSVGLARRYPMLLSGLSSILPVLGRRNRWFRLAAGVVLAWKVLKGGGKP